VRKAKVFFEDKLSGFLYEDETGKRYRFVYLPEYDGPPISLTMPISSREYAFNRFPPFFDGLLPEGAMLEGLLRERKLDAKDYFGQLTAVGSELVGAIRIEEAAG
jgi:serine/threonine-protein kinase HipA